PICALPKMVSNRFAFARWRVRHASFTRESCGSAFLYHRLEADSPGEPMQPLTIIGAVAAVCATSSYIPQIIKIRKQGGEDLSYSMLVLYLTGTALWLVYGLILNAAAVIWANAITGLLVVTAIVLKMPDTPKESSAIRKESAALD